MRGCGLLTKQTPGSFTAAGYITTCREEDADGNRCNRPAEFVLWGRLFPPDALGPRCYDHAVAHTNRSMPSMVSQWAVLDLRPVRRMVEAEIPS